MQPATATAGFWMRANNQKNGMAASVPTVPEANGAYPVYPHEARKIVRRLIRPPNLAEMRTKRQWAAIGETSTVRHDAAYRGFVIDAAVVRVAAASIPRTCASIEVTWQH